MSQDNDLEDEYPHWRTALFGNHNAVANIRCAVHYVFWHGVYGLLAALGLLLVGTIKFVNGVAQYLGPLADPIERVLNWALSGVRAFLHHDYTQAAFEWCVVGGFVLAGVAVTLMAAWFIYNHPIEFLHYMAVVLVMGAVLFGGVAIIDYLLPTARNAANRSAAVARQAGERAVETPGIRRVYGECPVSMEQAPHWFEDLFPEEDL